MSLHHRDINEYGDSQPATNYTTIIVVIVVILVLKICLIIGICYWRNKKRAERRARGCHCYDDSDYYCLPWWYWSNDRHCHCGASGNVAFNAPPAYAPGPMEPYRSVPGIEVNEWEPSHPAEMKPAYATSYNSNERYA